MKLLRTHRSHIYLSIIGAGLLFLALRQVFLPVLVMEVWDTKAGDLLLAVPVKQGGRFLLRYTHSTAKTIVEEHFQIAGSNDIILTCMVYSSGGAGIPDLPPSGAYFKIGPDGRFVMGGLNRRFKSLSNIRVAYFYPFILEVDGKRYDLSENARGRLVDIRVRHHGSSALDWLSGGSDK
jgi:hypothetical protein